MWRNSILTLLIAWEGFSQYWATFIWMPWIAPQCWYTPTALQLSYPRCQQHKPNRRILKMIKIWGELWKISPENLNFECHSEYQGSRTTALLCHPLRMPPCNYNGTVRSNGVQILFEFIPWNFVRIPGLVSVALGDGHYCSCCLCVTLHSPIYTAHVSLHHFDIRYISPNLRHCVYVLLNETLIDN